MAAKPAYGAVLNGRPSTQTQLRYPTWENDGERASLFGFVGLLVAILLAASHGVILRVSTRKALAGPDLDAAAAPSAPDVVPPKGVRAVV